MLACIRSNYQLDDKECLELMQLAESERDEVVSLHSLTRLLVEETSEEERVQLLELLWQVAYADGHIDKYEEHIIRRIADLLYVSHSGYIQAKLKAESGM